MHLLDSNGYSRPDEVLSTVMDSNGYSMPDEVLSTVMDSNMRRNTCYILWAALGSGTR